MEARVAQDTYQPRLTFLVHSDLTDGESLYGGNLVIGVLLLHGTMMYDPIRAHGILRVSLSIASMGAVSRACPESPTADTCG